MKLMSAAAGIAALLLPLTVEAEGFTTADLGSTKDDPECLERSHLMFDRLSKKHEIGEVMTGVANWSVIGFDISSEEYDAIITCAYGPNGETRATLVVYSTDASDHDVRDALAKEMNELWDSTK